MKMKALVGRIGQAIEQRSIGFRLVVGFGLVLMLVAVMGGFTLRAINSIKLADFQVNEALAGAAQVQQRAAELQRWLESLEQSQATVSYGLLAMEEDFLRNSEQVELFNAANDPITPLLNGSQRQLIVENFPETGPLFQQLDRLQPQLVQMATEVSQCWQPRHVGLANALNELKRSQLYWVLKVTNMIFIRSSIGELLYEELADTPLEEFCASPVYERFADSFPMLQQAIGSAQSANRRLWEASYALDSAMMDSDWEQARVIYRDQFPALAKSMAVDIDRVLLMENRILAEQQRAIGLFNADLKPAATKVVALIGQVRDQLGQDMAAHNQQVANSAVQVAAARQQVTAQIEATEWLNKALCLAILLIGAVASWRITRAIVGPLAQSVAMIQGLGRGELDRRLDLSSRDELGQLACRMNAFADHLQDEILTAFRCLEEGDFTFEAKGVIEQPLANANAALNRLLQQVRSMGLSIEVGSSQIAATGQSLAQGASEQADSVEEMGQSMAEITRQTKEDSANAQQASTLSEQARSSARRGQEQLEQMLAAMGEINDSAQAVSRIIKVIDEIAFQTNLLALNAAVEAARAGQHGKGFAVVAEEVRNLAARSARASAETTALIQGAIASTENGVRIAGQTSTALEEIVTETREVSQLVTAIASASSQQAQRIEQINSGLSQVDQVAQNNMALAEQSAAASAELTEQAHALHQLLSVFTLSPSVEPVERLNDTAVSEPNFQLLNGPTGSGRAAA